MKWSPTLYIRYTKQCDLLRLLYVPEWDSVVGSVTRLQAQHQEKSWFDSRKRQDNFLFFKTSRPVLVSTQLPIHWVLRFFPAGTQLGRKVNHSSSQSCEVQNNWTCTSTPPIRLHGVDKDKFTFFLTEDFSLEVKWTLSSAKVKEIVELYLHSPI